MPEKNSWKLTTESNCLVSLVASSSAKFRLCPPCSFVRKIRLLYILPVIWYLNIIFYCSVTNRKTSPSLSFSTLNFIQICVISFPSMPLTHLLPLFCHAVLFFGILLNLLSKFFFSPPVAPSLHGLDQVPLLSTYGTFFPSFFYHCHCHWAVLQQTLYKVCKYSTDAQYLGGGSKRECNSVYIYAHMCVFQKWLM